MLLMIRRRLSCEDGLSLIEMMVALFIVTVVLLGLLGVLVTSARAVLAQDLRSRGVRVLTTELEQVRARGYDALPVGVTERTHELGGHVFTARTEVEWTDASPLDDTGRDLKQVTTTVRWTVGGRTQTTTATAALRRPAGTPEDETVYSLEVQAAPTAVEVDAAGVPTAGFGLRALPHGFVHAGPMTVRWDNGDGSEGTAELAAPSPLLGDDEWWAGTILPAAVRMPLDPDASVTVPLSVTASGRTGDVAVTFYRRPPPPADAPALSEPLIASDDGVGVIAVRPPSVAGDCLTPACANDSAVTASVRMVPEIVADAQVWVEFDTRDADGLVRHPLLLGADGRHSVTLGPGAYAFTPGPAQPFSFVVTYGGEGQEWALPQPGGVRVEER